LSSHPGPACFILHGGFGFYATVFLLSRSFNAKENALFNLTNILLTIGIFALISGVATMPIGIQKETALLAGIDAGLLTPQQRNAFSLSSFHNLNNFTQCAILRSVHASARS